jgi:hypothetical protein
MIELHRHKAMLGTEQAAAIGYAKAGARARAVAIAINNEAMPPPTFHWASQNIAVATTLLDTLPTPSTDGISKVYQLLKNNLSVAAV